MLISVVNPWMLVEPAPLTSHSLAGLPGSEFSQTIGFAIGGLHGDWASATIGCRTRHIEPTSSSSARQYAALRRARRRKWVAPDEVNRGLLPNFPPSQEGLVQPSFHRTCAARIRIVYRYQWCQT